MKKKITIIVGLHLVLFMIPIGKASAQIPIVNVITAVVKKVIVALDLKVQQLQNKTIILQNAQKQLENAMAQGHLNDINNWLGQEKNLFSDYYTELARVKGVIADYTTVKTIIGQEARLVVEYKTAYTLFQQDKNFSPDEISYMANVYSGILKESLRNIDEVMLAVSSFQTQMNDGERLQLISHASSGMQKNLDDLRQFNNGNLQLAYQRGEQLHDVQTIKQLYGIQ